MTQWSPQQAQEWYKKVFPIKGCNYLPRTAVNSLEMWQAETFDPSTITQELGWAARWGYTDLRVFLSFTLWEHDPEGYKARIAAFLDLAQKAGLRTMPILFDDCAFSGREPQLGPQPQPIPGVHNSGWVPSPALSQIEDKSVWPRLEAYVKDIVGSFAQDPKVLVWDLYNEPGNSGMGERSQPLMEAAFRWARATNPSQPLTVGTWYALESAMSLAMLELSDVISFHAYEGPYFTQAKLEFLQRWQRPLLCTEWLHRPFGSSFASILPLFEQYQVGWYQWGLVAGKTQTYQHWGSRPGDPEAQPWQHDVLRPDGRPYNSEELELLSGEVGT